MADTVQTHALIRPSDLADPTLDLLNRELDFLFSRIALMEGISGDSFQFRRAELSNTKVPTDEHAFVTLGAYNQLSKAASKVTAVGLAGSHAERLTDFQASAFAIGTQFFETDRELLYVVKAVTAGSNPTKQWVYAAGYYKQTQIELGPLADSLTLYDDNLLVQVTDYGHILRWTAPSWGWGPGDDGRAGEVCTFTIAPTATGWHLCNGASVSRLNSDGTATTVTLPNLSGSPCYPKYGSAYTGTIVAANAPGISGSTAAVSAGTPAGTNSTPVFTGTAMGMHQHELPIFVTGNFLAWASLFGQGGSHTFTGNNAVGGSTTNNAELSQAVSAGTPAGTVTAPTFTGTALGTHSHGVGTLAVDATGEPAHLILLPYFRQ